MYGFVNLIRLAIPGLPLGGDFVIFETARQLVESGSVLTAYDPAQFEQAVKDAYGVSVDGYWYYPPPVFFLTLPLGFLPYIADMLIWSLASLYLFWRAVRTLTQNSPTSASTLAYGGVVIGILFGQSGLLISAALLTALAWRQTRPVAAGIMAVLVALKPQMAVILFLALLFEKNWRALASTAVSGLVLFALSCWCFGMDVWIAWATQLHHALEVITQNPTLWPWLASVFAAALGLGAPAWLATTLHVSVVIAVLALLWRFFQTRPDMRLWNAALILASCFISPYIYTYDLPLVAAAILLISHVHTERGWQSWQKETLTLAHFAPMVIPFAAMAAPVYFQPLILVALFYMATRQEKSGH